MKLLGKITLTLGLMIIVSLLLTSCSGGGLVTPELLLDLFEEVCEKLAESGINCLLEGPVPLIETGFTLGEFCHSIYNQNRRCFYNFFW